MSPAKDTRATVIPSIRYRDARAAIDFLCDAFGFEKRAVYEDGGKVVHAELSFGNGMIMLGEVRDTEFGRNLTQPDEVRGKETQAPYLIVADVDAHYRRAKVAGAVIVTDIKDEDYGGRDYTCRDLRATSGVSAATTRGIRRPQAEREKREGPPVGGPSIAGPRHRGLTTLCPTQEARTSRARFQVCTAARGIGQ
jgi:uncharacterized glyoxalase superfamily protein PhnB